MPHLFSSNLSILFFQLLTGLELYSLYAWVISANQGVRFSQPDLGPRVQTAPKYPTLATYQVLYYIAKTNSFN